MSKQYLAVFTLALAALALGANLGQAQILNVEIPFEFQIGDKTMPSGNYEIRGTSDTAPLTLKNKDTGETMVLTFMTRLSPREDRKGSVVFDNCTGASYLSEVYLPGVDGYQMQVAPGEHSHSTVKAK